MNFSLGILFVSVARIKRKAIQSEPEKSANKSP